ncbi:Asp-tRNA(Asn)/Glu-tRNA(Gln) amidotransferase subunit GatC [Apilactobacillus micheneri]|uniref:Aspartyl/glutamyl-tRNA(Asn/Gln) amidotransferase subunit C n=1 Tax=Apilactobacillus micheneri TaxID=1899430 RepID=A0ABY2Z103_9LACO|nr:Asp-tRNA(Asn)/Glu-tRNA(Gln) amidotransferase subunit GatC [Apilactobacillus micheneri]TPR24753.1 Asp-tRNA(Asn)/Glu-tRNA(Gln) amidotransferase subunit GatC [Apilactobacillus micheneri]TPR26064.1 Asp-tRNA(Asn)/Glu-tRNA(Gln) amidotransferase subunit GatC [Apilactobacillus micheneri]TPR28254.1 Asp-tRNA(Asn)/Glu-tRNA(Gln) amidotransferase subunit GatC [Apilactobacillus micheneri]TPR29745.1 Asp-tRNA(Asn)/Glu-tRNA(Gln) amidotransferase subunit GatC [Apilactobacillus micheneri]TPR30531.1 Asp-tRNA(A
MSEKISKDTVSHVSSLAKLELTDKQLPYFTDQLGNIMGIFDSLNEVDTNDVEPTFSVTDQINVMREDVADNWGERDQLLQNAPDVADGLIRTPTIIDESGD